MSNFQLRSDGVLEDYGYGLVVFMDDMAMCVSTRQACSSVC